MSPADAPRVHAGAMLSIRDLRVVFDSRHGLLTAIDGVSLDIAPGENLGVVGGSGAGKSLTGTMVIGLLDPPGRIAGGSIHLEGERIDDLPASEMRRICGRKISAVFQDPLTSLPPLLRVGDQIVETILAHLDVSRAEARRRALTLLHEVGIPSPETRIGHYPHQFSGGMRQRVVIALALCAEPRLIIFVESGPAERVFAAPEHPYTRLLLDTIPDVDHPNRDRRPMFGEVPSPIAPPPGRPFHRRCASAQDSCRRERPRAAAASRRRCGVPPRRRRATSQAACRLSRSSSKIRAASIARAWSGWRS